MTKKSTRQKSDTRARRAPEPGRASHTAGATTLEMESLGAAVVIVDRSGSVVRASGWEKIANAPVPTRIPAGADLPDQLLDGIHGTGEGDVLDRAIDVYVKRLREKLGDDANTPRYVATVRGVGYRAAGRVERRRAEPATR